eukprot:Amastigsp_a356985_8.p3 type:complete len:178 gc:universal Amastigsp_a356985_8:616-83(-)
MHGRVEPDVAVRAVEEVDGVCDARRVKAFVAQLDLHVLERRCDVDGGHKAQEQRDLVRGQIRARKVEEARKGEPIVRDACNGGHACAPLERADDNAVDVELERDARVELTADLCDLGRGDVLRAPSEGVAEAVVEVDKALCVAAQKIAGSEVRVAFLEDVVNHFALRGLARGVAGVV